MSFKSISVLLAAIWVAISAIIITANPNSYLPEATIQAGEVDFIFKFMLVASAFIFLVIWGFVIYLVLRYRHRKGEDEAALGMQLHGHTGLEITWTVLPALFLVALSVFSIRVWADENATPPPGALTVNVTGQQFAWSYSYPKLGIKNYPVLHLIVNRQTNLNLHSPDVIHSFWIPAFRIQENVVPGISTYERFKPTRVGIYPALCSEFCGTGHSGMTTTVEVDTPAQFASWAKSQGAKNI